MASKSWLTKVSHDIRRRRCVRCEGVAADTDTALKDGWILFRPGRDVCPDCWPSFARELHRDARREAYKAAGRFRRWARTLTADQLEDDIGAARVVWIIASNLKFAFDQLDNGGPD